MLPPFRSDRDVMAYDVVIVGAGPAGLSCAIRLKQRAAESGRDLSVCVLEKGAEVGAHLLSGAVFDPRALAELFPDYERRGAPLITPAREDRFLFLTRRWSLRLPTPPQMRGHGSHIISLGLLAKFLAREAEALGVDVFPGFAASELLIDEQGVLRGVATGDMGLDRNGQPTNDFMPGAEIHARQTVLAEGCHGSLTKQAIRAFALRGKDDCPQTYGLGVKEIWEVPSSQHRPGLVLHSVGWPMDMSTYGGGWIYHYGDNLVSIGYVTGLDYKNPYLSPYEEMQRFKLHPAIRRHIEGGRRIAYGARALVEGGLQALPRLTFPGGLLIGDSAGFLNVARIKGNHTAMKSGMVAAEALADHLTGENGPAPAPDECASYPDRLRQSWLWDELYRVRNIRPGFRWGLIGGLLHAAFQTFCGWKLSYTLRHHPDYASLSPAADVDPIAYPKPDGVLTFDRLTSVSLTGTRHAEGQPCHLKLADPDLPIRDNLTLYDEPAQRYCPAGVYEVVRDPDGAPRFQINAQNCIHCKTCDIKDPAQNITWTVPQGGEGPAYGAM